MGDEVDFLPADKHESFLQIEISLWVCIARYVHSTQNKVTISLQYKKKLKEKMNFEVDFLPADIRQIFPQNDTIILGVWPGLPKLPKIICYFFAIS